MKTKSILNTVGITMAVGSAAMIAGAAAMKPGMKKAAKKKLNNAMHMAEDLLDNVQDFLK